MNTRPLFLPLLSFLMGSFLSDTPRVYAQGPAFTYQGRLDADGAPVSGLHDMRFRLYDADLGGNQVGPTLCMNNVEVEDGLLTVELNFGAVFDGGLRYLAIEVREDTGLSCATDTGFVMLEPRQSLTASPHATFAASAANANQFGNQNPAHYLNASNLSAGTLPDARLSSNVATLSGAQTFSGGKAFSTAPSFASAGAPFSVASTARVTSLNADLLDGQDSSSVFATTSHTHNASAIVSGTLSDARIPSSVPRLGISNVFSDTQVITVFGQTPLTLIGSNTGGTWLNLSNTGGGRTWNLIATGSGNSEGPGKLLVRDQTGGAVRMTVDSSGRVGVGTTSPSALLELSQGDAALRLRNVNDTGGGYIQNTFSTLQLGMFNPTASAWGTVPPSGTRAVFGVQNTGRVGTLTNTSGSPVWRNTLDDGAGNASIQGNLTANNMPAIKFASTAASGTFANNSVTLIENITVNVPAAGFLRITARAGIFLKAYDAFLSRATLELKETTVGEVVIKDSEIGVGDGAPSASGMGWSGDITLEHSTAASAGTRSFKLRLLHNSSTGSNFLQYGGAEITVMYLANSL